VAADAGALGDGVGDEVEAAEDLLDVLVDPLGQFEQLVVDAGPGFVVLDGIAQRDALAGGVVAEVGQLLAGVDLAHVARGVGGEHRVYGVYMCTYC
jgi:hypothetical protein